VIHERREALCHIVERNRLHAFHLEACGREMPREQLLQLRRLLLNLHGDVGRLLWCIDLRQGVERIAASSGGAALRVGDTGGKRRQRDRPGRVPVAGVAAVVSVVHRIVLVGHCCCARVVCNAAVRCVLLAA
jgi:hypothetical protein